MFSRRFIHKFILFTVMAAFSASLSACKTSQPSDLSITPASIWAPGQIATTTAMALGSPTLSYTIPPTRVPGSPELTPTPDAAHYQASTEHDPQTYVVQNGDMLSTIAQKYSVSVQALAQANNISDINALIVGETLTIPVVPLQAIGPDYKIIPDSELVYGPLSAVTDVEAFIHSKGGFLANYTQDVNGETLTAAQVVVRAAQSYSVNPRLLLALLEYRSGWLTKTNPDPALDEQPFGFYDAWYHGLFRQLEWAAIQLNSGYYRWRSNAVTGWVLADGSVVPVAPTINAGTAGVQNFFAQLDDLSTWLKDVSPGGFFDTYYLLFGYPFDLAIEPLIPARLVQPAMLLPFGSGETWAFTGGPHLSWDAGTPYGALDFAPPGEAQGCVEVDYWVTAVAGGLVTRTGDGVVIQDLDGDGNEGSGWVILYMHIESRDRVQPGTVLHAGDRVGHPSCEGGQSSGTHVHLARKFNGEWMSATGPVPFNLSGWISAGTGEQYVGTLTRNGVVVENFEGNSTVNQIQR
jgi:LysM repeat protein